MLTEQTEEHSYIYAGGKLLRETEFIVDEQGSEIERTFDFRYDNAGLPYALHYTDTFEGIEQTYYYITNLQGDVMYMVDEGGDEVASYDYDPYGKLLYARGDMAEVNPIRYRGYYYDTETDFYYLQSRYYDPAICRFINADGFASTGQGLLGYNMFAYCNNNSVNAVDTKGNLPTHAVMMKDSGAVSDSYRAKYVIPVKEEYSRKNWESASVQKKKDLLNQHMLEVSDLLNVYVRPEINFYYKEPENGLISLGYYTYATRTISINEYILTSGCHDSYQLYQTVRHELRHAYQHAVVNGFIPADGESLETIIMWQVNIDNYISPSSGFNEYNTQPIERDARLFALQ